MTWNGAVRSDGGDDLEYETTRTSRRGIGSEGTHGRKWLTAKQGGVRSLEERLTGERARMTWNGRVAKQTRTSKHADANKKKS
ncbi:hypothetical protein R1flu_015679 [Riccia fluitans]|uniref:Uncharacterized protein n=1 Tax=Riccia fluitans TaxID=41844 RepID=A0ABD1YJM2_9MARC